MKNKLEITLKTIHLGSEKRFVTLNMQGDDSVDQDILQLARKDSNKLSKLRTVMRVISEHKHYSNEQKFKNLKRGLYEIKIHGYRVYAFLDNHSASEQQLIICSLCGGKTKQQSADIATARKIRTKYLELTQKKGVQPKLEFLPNETNE